MTTKEEAKNYLREVYSEQCFWVNNGNVLKNIEELANALATISDETYGYHVNGERNDFSKWVNDILGDKKLANELLSSKNRQSASKKVKDRLSSLKKKAV